MDSTKPLGGIENSLRIEQFGEEGQMSEDEKIVLHFLGKLVDTGEVTHTQQLIKEKEGDLEVYSGGSLLWSLKKDKATADGLEALRTRLTEVRRQAFAKEGSKAASSYHHVHHDAQAAQLIRKASGENQAKLEHKKSGDHHAGHQADHHGGGDHHDHHHGDHEHHKKEKRPALEGIEGRLRIDLHDKLKNITADEEKVYTYLSALVDTSSIIHTIGVARPNEMEVFADGTMIWSLKHDGANAQALERLRQQLLRVKQGVSTTGGHFVPSSLGGAREGQEGHAHHAPHNPPGTGHPHK